MKLITTALLLVSELTISATAVDHTKSAAQIDALIEKNYAPNDVTPNPLSDDATFVRRAYLDIIGRIPTAAEARPFLNSMAPDKRAKLIDQLLDSDGYTSHQFNYWADILRINSRLNGQGPQNGAAYIRWVKEAIRSNMKYDVFVRELITAEGMVDQNGAAGFYLRDRGMPLDHLATTVQVFLGTQMVCAQCHDHPFDEWTQMDYYELAAFSTPMDVVRSPDSIRGAVQMIAKETNARAKKNPGKKNKNKNVAKNKIRKATRDLSQLSYNFRNSVIGETNKDLKLPHDYQYNDAEPKAVVNPLTPFGDKITVQEGESRIQAYGKWMTASSNPRFTKTIANRLWKRVMGIGLIEPVDNMMEGTTPTNPELMAHLEKLFVSLDYDIKAYYRVLYNTKTYQREAESADMLSKYYFPGPRLRRMSAEQVWDSLITLIRTQPDTAPNPRPDAYANNTNRLDAWNRLSSKSPEELIKRQKELAAFTERSTKRLDQIRTEIDSAVKKKDEKRAIALGQQLITFDDRSKKEYARLTYWDPEALDGRYFQTPFRNVPRTLIRQLKSGFPKVKFKDRVDPTPSMMAAKKQKKANRNPDKQELKRLRKEMGADDFQKMLNQRREKDRVKNYVRASELTSPAPDGHFLRAFGQSDRQLIENANDQASVPQALALLNGPLYYAITSQASVITEEANTETDTDATIDAIYLSMLSRKATDKEQSLLRPEFEAADNRPAAIRATIWTLLNTQQFLFVQ